ncbi:uncharacterized protein PV09_01837 [Verruconis gallopava]|uniref:Uncharacterized protein n=1 Tax=Verruconis gallopava TaxID=253628 RepID=A0A0D2AN36_9PEZI|nr:uncharacterized protein PV09_01837 [Verruconis gallopava]KIW07930.1 hypothetical protein PV09_01837 [Verruconis gallopava]
MFRRPALRQFSSLSRSQFRLQQASRLQIRPPPVVQNGTPVKHYRVRFVKPPLLSWRRSRKWLLYGMTFWAFLQYVLPEFITISFEEVEEEVVGEDGEVDVQTEEGEEEVEEGLFIPFGWPKKQPRTYYRASDPEWKEFMKFSKQVERHKEVQRRLVSAIRSEIAGLPGTKRLLGAVDVSKGRYWLEIVFPDGPPQDYEVHGIEITDEFVAWSVKTVSQKEYARLCRTMIPTATIKASWASIKYQFDIQANKVREYLGLQPKIDPEVALIKASLRERPNTKHFGSGNNSPKTPANPLSKGFPPQPITSPSGQNAEASNSESSEPSIPRLPSIVPRGENKPVTLALFLHNLRKNRGPTPIEPPRGSVVVTGLIEVIGTNGRVTLDVSAAFDPRSDEYVLWSWRPRRIQPKAQRPKGGP